MRLLQAELARRAAADRTASQMTEEMRREIAAARTVTALQVWRGSCGMRLHAACVSCVSCGSRWQAKQFEAELAELRAARDEEAGSLTAQLEGCRRTERDLIEEISKTNLELTLVHSEKEQAVARGEAAERERDRTRERMTESNKAAV